MAVVATLAVVQSIVGVGVLVFGTPTLLLIGYSFQDALAVLLPASLAISLLQIRDAPRFDARFVLLFTRWCLAPLAVTLTLVLVLRLRASLTVALALLLFLFSLGRVFHSTRESAAAWVSSHWRAWLCLTGIVHGLSNLGGATLLIFAVSRHRDRHEARALLAFCYACFAAVQLTILGMIAPRVFEPIQFAYAGVAGAVYCYLGRQVVRRAPSPILDWSITVFAASYGVLLMWQFIGQL
jgi:uncharacterized membrane protein YfcA